MVKCKSGERHVAMSHYPPTNRAEQVRSLRQSVNQFSRNCNDDFLSRELVVLTPGDWFKGDHDKYDTFKPKDTELYHISALGAAAKIEKLLVSPYSEDRSLEKRYYPDFQVELKPDGTFWYSFGDNHISHKALELEDRR